MTIHERYMNRCLELAALGAGNAAPNPMVGAVLVYEDRIIGEGWHQRYGEAHAEVNCIREAIQKGFESRLISSTLYVSLEPCAHFGKTPPCADLIITQGIPRVVIGCSDPFKEVDGKGIEKLKSAGVEVITGVLEKESKELNKRFFTFHQQQRPYVILKWAQTADGKISSGNEQRLLISNDYSNRLVHKWRSEEAAILVGTNTALADNPALTTRLWEGASPVRLVLDMNLRLPASLWLFDRSVKTIVFNASMNKEENNLLHYRLDPAEKLPGQITKALYELKIQSVLIEGGAKMLQSFIDENLWDEARVIQNMKQANVDNVKGITAPALSPATEEASITLKDDSIKIFKRTELDS